MRSRREDPVELAAWILFDIFLVSWLGYLVATHFVETLKFFLPGVF